MPNQRRKDWSIISFQVDTSYLESIDALRANSTRAKYMRQLMYTAWKGTPNEVDEQHIDNSWGTKGHETNIIDKKKERHMVTMHAHASYKKSLDAARRPLMSRSTYLRKLVFEAAKGTPHEVASGGILHSKVCTHN